MWPKVPRHPLTRSGSSCSPIPAVTKRCTVEFGVDAFRTPPPVTSAPVQSLRLRTARDDHARDAMRAVTMRNDSLPCLRTESTQ